MINVMFYAATTAPADYDYSYVQQIATHGAWRILAVTDAMRYEGFQSPRYASGMHPDMRSDNLADLLQKCRSASK